MPTPEQKKLWRQEKEQQRRDKLNQPREVKRRAVPLKLGQTKKQTTPAVKKPLVYQSDEALRKQLGL